MAVAVADLVPNTDVEVSGTVTFQQNTLGGATIVKGVVKGLNPLSKHGFHIHTSSDKSHACQSYGGRYNPYGRSHGGPQDQNRHIGDLGNIVADENGVASFTLHEKLVSLIGSTTVLGRGVVVHAGEDDLGRGGDAGSLATGNSGGRLACGPIICRTCFDTLAATAGIKSDDGTNHGHLEFFQEYRVGFTEQMVSLQSIISTRSYNYGEFAAIKHEEYVKQGKQCAAIFTSGMLNGSVDQEWDLTIEGNKVQRRSFSNGPIKSLVGKVVAYRLSQRTTNGDVTQSVTLCGTVWPTPYEKCACVILRTKTGTCGELCFGQQICGGLVSIEGKIDQTCLSDANNVAGFSTMDYAIPTDQCLDAYVTQIIELPLQRDSDGTALICTKSSGPSLREPGSLAGRTFLVHDSDGDPVACGVTEYRATCPKSHC
jgi:Cu-Zn family superoxide dismutase